MEINCRRKQVDRGRIFDFLTINATTAYPTPADISNFTHMEAAIGK